MGRAVAERADLAIVTSDNPRGEDPRRSADEILSGFDQAAADVEVESGPGRGHPVGPWPKPNRAIAS